MLADQIPLFDLRRQDTKNRQNSIDDIDPFVKQEFEIKIKKHFEDAMRLYKEMLNANIAKECSKVCIALSNAHRLYARAVLFAHGSII